MDPLSILGALSGAIALYQLTSDIAKLCISYGSEVRQGSRDMQQFVDEIIQFQNSMWRLQRALSGESAEVLDEDRLKYLRDVIGTESANLKQCQNDLEDLSAKLEKLLSRTGLARIHTKVTWPLKSDDAKKTISRMKSIRDAITNAASLDTNDVVRGIDTRQRVMEKDMELSKQQELAKELRRRVLKWLRHPDPSENHNLAASARNERIKSGSWLLESDQVKKFRSTKKSLLWMYGIAGCGKSILSSVVIDRLKELGQKDSDLRLAYWYFNSNDKQRMSFESMMRALISQLLPKPPADVPATVEDTFRLRSDGSEAPKLIDLGVMLRKMVAGDTSAEFYIIIDALDESSPDAGEREQFLSIIKDLLSSGSSSVHIYITSRPQEEIRSLLDELVSTKRIDLEVDASRDISKHIEDQLKNDRALSKWPRKTQLYVKKTLLDKAGGMFRWVECQLQALKKCSRPALLEATLGTLPHDLFEQYARELEHVNDVEAEDALRLLQWLTFPQRKLRLEEAVEMLAVNFDTDPPSFAEDQRMFNPRQVLDICGSLVRIDTNKDGRNHMGEKAKVQTLTTAHSTVLDFLKSKQINIGSLKDCTFRSGPVNLRMAETCMVYLHNVVKKGDNLTARMIRQYPFARYCAEFWDDQYRLAYAEKGTLDFTRLNRLVLEVLEDKKAALNYVRLCDPDFDEDGVDLTTTEDDLCSPLYYAALHGLPDIAQQLIDKGADINEDNPGYYGTALVAAAANGHIDTVKLLLNAGGDPLKASERKGYPIAMAVETDHLEIVKLLLQQPGANINCLRMPPEMIEMQERLLARKKLEVRDSDRSSNASDSSSENSGSDSGSSSSSTTDSNSDDSNAGKSSSGSESSSDSDKDEDSSSDSGSENASGKAEADKSSSGSGSSSGTGDEASSGGDTDTDSTGSGSGSKESSDKSSSGILTDSEDEAKAANEGLVYIAADNYSVETLAFLLENEADPNIVGGEKQTAFIAACHGGKKEIIDLLLQFSAQVDIYGGLFGSSLQAACMNSDMLPLLEKLVSMGVEVNYYSSDGQSALYAAADCKELDYLKFLLQQGHEVQPPENLEGGRLPLTAASWQGYEPIMEALITAGADISRKDPKDGCPLCAACSSGEVGSVRLLLAKSANVKETGCTPYNNCLQACMTSGNKEIINLLLDHGADMSLQGGRYGTALQAAAYSSDKKIVKMLVERGADVSAEGGRFGTPLQAATASYDIDCIKILIEHGASPNTRAGKYGWPLLRACKTGWSSIVECLIDNGADLTVRLDEEIEGKGDGDSALRISHDEDITKILKKKGADINENTGLLGTPLTFAARRGKMPTVKALVSLGANLEGVDKLRGMTPLLHAADQGDIKMVMYLIKKGVDITARDRGGRSALTIAICRSNLELTKLLVGSGIKPNQLDSREVSDVHYAAASGNIEICGLVLKAKKLDLHAVDANGWSALHWATQSSRSRFIVMQKLLSLGVDKDLKDKNGMKVIDLAEHLKLTDVVPLLQADAADALKMKDQDHSHDKIESAQSEKPCDICGSLLGEHWLCKTCTVFELCARCMLDKQVVHNGSHDFEVVEDLTPGLSNQDPEIPDVVEHPSSPLKKDLKLDLAPLQTDLATEPNTTVAAETPLEVRWLDQRFRTNTFEAPVLANLAEPILEPNPARAPVVDVPRALNTTSTEPATEREAPLPQHSQLGDETSVSTPKTPDADQSFRHTSQSRAPRDPVARKALAPPSVLRPGRPQESSMSSTDPVAERQPPPLPADPNSPPKSLRKIPTGLQPGRRGKVHSPTVTPGSLPPGPKPSSGVSPSQSWENRRYSRPDASLAALAQSGTSGRYVAFSARGQRPPADVYHNTRHDSMATLGAHTHPVPQQGRGTRHASIDEQGQQLPASSQVFALPANMSLGYGSGPFAGVEPVELPARETSVKQDDRDKWERSKIDYENLYDDDSYT